MKKLILSVVMLIGITNMAFGWGQTGHNVIAYIAECNLAKKARKNIEKYLDHSIVYYSVWMDNYRHTPEYGHTTYWHMASVNEELYYTDEVRDPRGDAVSELENAIKRLKSYKSLDDSTVIVNLKYVIHMVGDMHCPVHVRYPGITNFDVTLNNNKYSYHTIWDSNIIDLNHKWGYTEWQQQLDRCSKKEKEKITAGSPRDWFHETAIACRIIYEMANANSELGKDFLNEAIHLGESQILKAGYRLASVLNELFDK